MSSTPENPAYERPVANVLRERLAEPRRFLEVLAGPRQVGKTTAVHQVLRTMPVPSHYASGDDPLLRLTAWVDEQWGVARALAAAEGTAILALDEVHRVPGWADRIKALWDEDSCSAANVRVVLVGSSPWLLHQGLAERLHGRFETIRADQWSYAECRAAFVWDLDTYLFFGGYPGAAPLITDAARWRAYVRDSLLESTVARDVLALLRVDKPALMRQLLLCACELSGQIVSLTKLLGQLRDAGNVTTLAHYLRLLSTAGLVTELQKYSGSQVRRRASIPKLLVLDTALMSAAADMDMVAAKADGQYWGRLVESAVGAHLVRLRGDEVMYWNQGQAEVDYVVASTSRRPGSTRPLAVEVKSGRPRSGLRGLDLFLREYGPAETLLVGAGGLSLEEFLLLDSI